MASGDDKPRHFLADSAIATALVSALAYAVGLAYLRMHLRALGIPAAGLVDAGTAILASVGPLVPPVGLFVVAWFALRLLRGWTEWPPLRLLLVGAVTSGVWVTLVASAGLLFGLSLLGVLAVALGVTIALWAGHLLRSEVRGTLKTEWRHGSVQTMTAFMLVGAVVVSAGMMGLLHADRLLAGCGAVTHVEFHEAEVPGLGNRTFLLLAEHGGQTYIMEDREREGNRTVLRVASDAVLLASLDRDPGRLWCR